MHRARISLGDNNIFLPFDGSTRLEIDYRRDNTNGQRNELRIGTWPNDISIFTDESHFEVEP